MKKMLLCLFLSILISTPALQADDNRQALRRTPVVEVVEKTRTSIVNISSTSQSVRYIRSPFGMGIFNDVFQVPSESTSLGSGFVIHEDGYLVTNAHVVARTTEHKVTFADGQEYEAELIATDGEHDLAVLKINPEQGQQLEPIPIGRSDDLMIGETTIAIGNPVGLQNTVTTGVISALHRDVEFSNDVVYRDLIQTDASINPGNSGGPLLNILGELIGITTAIRGDAQNIGFAIPADRLKDLLPGMLDIEKRYRVAVGLVIDHGKKPVVQTVREGTPAEEAGLKQGDILLEVAKTPVDDHVDYHIAMLGCQPGDRIDVKVKRGDKTITKTLELRPIPIPDGRKLAWELYGLKLDTIPRKAARRLGLRTNAGLLITEVEPNSPAGYSGIQKGDMLVQLGPLRIRDIESVGLVLESQEPNQPAYIRLWRFYRNGGVDAFEGNIQPREKQ